MKIVHVVFSLGTGGAEKLVAQISNLLGKESDIEVRIISLFPFRGVPYKMINQNNVELIQLNSHLRFNPRLIYKIYKYTKGFDIIHTHTFYAQIYCSIICDNKKLVTTEHNTYNNRRKSFFLKFLDYFMYRKYRRIICISEATKLSLNTWLRSTQKNSIVINNGIDISYYRNSIPLKRSYLNVAETDILLCCVASFTVQKNHIRLLKAMKYVDDDIKLLLVGDGPLSGQISDVVKKLKLENRVIILGLRDDVNQILKTSDIFILPSLWEGFGLVAVEAAASKLPLILANVPGLSNLFQEQEVNFINLENVEDISHKINSIAKDLKLNKIEPVFSNLNYYSINEMYENYKKIYEEILN